MFLKYRIRRLQIKTDVQRCLVDQLKTAEALYQDSYYTDSLHKAVCKLLELNSKLEYLKGKLKEVGR